MSENQVYLIRSALRDNINDIFHAATVRMDEGNMESHDFFIQRMNEMKDALAAFENTFGK